MTYYENYDEDARYAKEVYWDSKGMGYLTPAPAPVVYVRDTECPVCGRVGSARDASVHVPKCKG
jgi:hypothetical protein